MSWHWLFPIYLHHTVQCRGKHTKFPGRPGGIYVTNASRTLATGDLYPDNVEIMRIFSVARHILVNIEVSIEWP